MYDKIMSNLMMGKTLIIKRIDGDSIKVKEVQGRFLVGTDPVGTVKFKYFDEYMCSMCESGLVTDYTVV